MPGAGANLAGRIVTITGAGSGIGGAVALAAATEKARLVLCDLDSNALAATASDCRVRGATAIETIAGDASSRATARALVDSAIMAFGRIDGLVCAGMTRRHAAAENVSEADWAANLEQGLTGPFRCAQEAGRAMLAQGSGSIVIITSTGGQMAAPGIAAYAAAKAGAAGLVRQLGVEWAARGVRVNAVAPGVTLAPDGRMSFESDLIERMVPTGKPVLADEIAQTCLFLLSDAAPGLTGQELTVDGGATVGRGFACYAQR